MVQSFLNDEVETLIVEPAELEQWQKLVEELELDGQKQLQSEPGKSPIPFPSMNAKMHSVYKTLCPEHTKYKQYCKSTIPLQVLSLIALSEKEKYFDRIEIWSDDKTPDPLAVGIKITETVHGEGDNTWTSKKEEKFIIARWGDELRPFKELAEKAFERILAHVKLEIKKAEQKLKTADPEIIAREYANGEKGRGQFSLFFGL